MIFLFNLVIFMFHVYVFLQGHFGRICDPEENTGGVRCPVTSFKNQGFFTAGDLTPPPKKDIVILMI